MCGGKQPTDNSAELARKREEERQARITEGRTAIDTAFSDAFNDDYYNDYSGQVTGFYLPRLEDQFSKANDRLTLQLASTGNLRSSAGIRALQDLQEEQNRHKLDIENRGVNAVNGLKGDIERAKDSLYAQNTTAADPGAASASAASRVESLLGPPELDPLGDLFSNFFANLNNAQVASQRAPANRSSGVTIFGGSGGGSSSVVT
jgi:hypothetical protein